ncbi:MAG: acylneuraminate cytidylyltransferase family protein [Gammaproteobacteria bacterium]|nr:MAG: acylneuraminate cytidylyltransferase family protein [Gammaproteobacteria bacterium]
MRVLSIIPARGGSKRLPGKNTKLLFDKPLICWSIDFAKSIPWITEIQISTDSQEIVTACLQSGIHVERLRPSHLGTDEVSSIDVVLELLEWLESQGKTFDVVSLLQPTTPVRYVERWNTAIDMLSKNICDAVVGVSISEVHPYLHYKKDSKGFLNPWICDHTEITRSQDYPFSCSINGSLYMIKVKALLEQKTFIPKKCIPVICADQVENIDIDTSFDWQVAEILISNWIAK